MIPLLRQKVNAYYKVAVKHLKDIIPQNIKYLLMHKAGKQL